MGSPNIHGLSRIVGFPFPCAWIPKQKEKQVKMHFSFLLKKGQKIINLIVGQKHQTKRNGQQLTIAPFLNGDNFQPPSLLLQEHRSEVKLHPPTFIAKLRSGVFFQQTDCSRETKASAVYCHSLLCSQGKGLIFLPSPPTYRCDYPHLY